jgi:hypothetical protein
MILIVARCGFQEKEKEKKRGRTKEPVVWKRAIGLKKSASFSLWHDHSTAVSTYFERQTCDPVDERCGMFPKFSLEPRAM